MPRFLVLLVLALSLFAIRPGFAADPFNNRAPAPAASAPQAPSSALSASIVEGQRQAGLELRRALIDIRARGLASGALLAGLAVSFLYGVLHALGPGHGKAVVVGYFLGQQARPWRGLWMGTRIAITHVGGAIILAAGFWFWYGQQPAANVEDIPAVRMIAAVLLLLLGALMLRDALKRPAVEIRISGCDCGDERHHRRRPPEGRDKGNIAALVAGWVPCTGAVIVLLFCIANGLWLAGLLLVSAIALGMACTMAVIGLLAILLRSQISGWIDRRPKNSRAMRALDLAGPILVMVFAGLLLLVDLRLV
ncbi:nickel/cobalt transporter [Lacibacterium aquatile]|uniref:Nickel/cobalt efflux system n=1 Tax=Lacibacterium aquatile TaxID=1168082 RepID=A0ABW5DP22_9PROT